MDEETSEETAGPSWKPVKKLLKQALEWSTTRGSRSGRTAFQFIQDLAGRMGRQLDS